MRGRFAVRYLGKHFWGHGGGGVLVGRRLGGHDGLVSFREMRSKRTALVICERGCRCGGFLHRLMLMWKRVPSLVARGECDLIFSRTLLPVCPGGAIEVVCRDLKMRKELKHFLLIEDGSNVIILSHLLLVQS